MFGSVDQPARPSRVIGAILAIALEIAVIVLVWKGFSVPAVRAGLQSTLASLDLRNPPPPARKPPPDRPARAASGRSAPAHIHSHAAPVVAPPVIALKPPPVPAAIVAGTGAQAAAGAAPLPGPGSGAGGQGQGTGSGDSGAGAGDGGREVELVRGRIRDADIPPALRGAAFSGTSRVEVAVGTQGEVTACRTLHSSGSNVLDALTCRLIFERFRFRPALDRRGRPRPDTIIYEQEWTIVGHFGDDAEGQ